MSHDAQAELVARLTRRCEDYERTIAELREQLTAQTTHPEGNP